MGEGAGGDDRLDSWKEIASYLRRSERTVRRWEAHEGLPVHRLHHEKKGSVYAYRSELDAWRASRKDTADVEQSVVDVTAFRGGRSRVLVAAIGTVTGLLVLAVVWTLREAVPPPATISAIAVLPFVNLSSDAQEEWFSDGMTETLTTELAKLGGVRVISRTSAMRYRGSGKSAKEIASELAVDAIVEGSAVHAAGQVRITAQLIDAATETHVWAGDYDGNLEDVLALQRDVARAIAREIGVVTRGPSPWTRRITDSRAVASYLQGLYQFNRGELQSAIDFAREASDIDPRFAPAHELLGMGLVWRAVGDVPRPVELFPGAEVSLERALELEPDRPLALMWLGTLHMLHRHDWAAAEATLRKAFDLDPSTGTGYAFLLAQQGRHDEAVHAATRALEHDPANPLYLADAGRIHHMARRYDEAERFLRRASDLSPSYVYPRGFLPYTLWAARRTDDAVDAWLWFRNGKGPLGLDQRFWNQRRAEGWKAVWSEYLERASTEPDRRLLLPLIALGHYEAALTVLDALEEQRNPVLIVLEDPIFDPLRGQPRFKALLERLRYPASMWQ